MDNINLIFKNERERQNLTLEEVSKVLKIRPFILEAIEKGEYDRLPGIYMKASIKEYAKFLKIKVDTDELVESLAPQDVLDKIADESNRNTLAHANQPKNYEELFSEKKIKKNFFKRSTLATYLIFAAIILVMIALVYIALFDYSGNAPKETNYVSDQTTETIGSESDYSEKNLPDSIKFNLHAHDTLWLRVASDGIVSKQMVLRSGTEFEISAKEFITLTCDKANALSVRRDGILLPKLSNHGTVIRNVQITRDEIINPTSVFSSDTNRRKIVRKNKLDTAKKVQQPYRLQPSVQRPENTPTIRTTTPVTQPTKTTD
ncbi:MAG: helix-turn-helix domain-containing protein [Candidatus Kapabacteria bacterium]|nr:helix-turn-helix domain-containing protein [Candidatus Kapabacteria bacterium]